MHQIQRVEGQVEDTTERDESRADEAQARPSQLDMAEVSRRSVSVSRSNFGGNVTDVVRSEIIVFQALDFWMYQLNGPLPTVLQNPSNPAVRATGCDAISTIGAQVFLQIPVISTNIV